MVTAVKEGQGEIIPTAQQVMEGKVVCPDTADLGNPEQEERQNNMDQMAVEGLVVLAVAAATAGQVRPEAMGKSENMESGEGTPRKMKVARMALRTVMLLELLELAGLAEKAGMEDRAKTRPAVEMDRMAVTAVVVEMGAVAS